MKQTIEIPLGNYVSSGSTLELVDVFLLACLFDGKPVMDTCLKTNKKIVDRIIGPYSITWDRAKNRFAAMNKLGYLSYKLNNSDVELIVLKNAELLFNGLRVEEFSQDKTPQVVALNETDEETNYMNWIINGPLKHSTYVSKSKTDMKSRISFIESYRRIRKTNSKEEVFQAITFATRDEFWRKQFLSPLKLEQVQKSSGMKYIDVFLGLRNASKPISAAPSQKVQTNSRSLE